MGVYLTSVHLISVYLMACASWRVPRGVYLMDMCLTGIHLMGIHLWRR
jgi:hypothetical protein